MQPVMARGSAAHLSRGRRSSEGRSARWKTGPGKGEEGVPVRGVKMYDIAR